MQCYNPLSLVIIGAIISFIASILVRWYALKLRYFEDRKNLIASLLIEINSIINLMDNSIRNSAPEVTSPLPLKPEMANLCIIYRQNCGKIGSLRSKAAVSVFEFYTSVFSLMPAKSDQSIGYYKTTDIKKCIEVGRPVLVLLEKVNKNAWNRRKQ